MSPVRAVLPRTNTCAESAVPEGAQPTFVWVYPGFHIGLCPHSTLGFAGVPCLKALVISLNFDALVFLIVLKFRNNHYFCTINNYSDL